MGTAAVSMHGFKCLLPLNFRNLSEEADRRLVTDSDREHRCIKQHSYPLDMRLLRQSRHSSVTRANNSVRGTTQTAPVAQQSRRRLRLTKSPVTKRAGICARPLNRERFDGVFRTDTGHETRDGPAGLERISKRASRHGRADGGGRV